MKEYKTLCIGNLVIELQTKIVRVNDNRIYLTDVEYNFLVYMVEHNYVDWVFANKLIYGFAGESEEKDKHAFTVSRCIIAIVKKLQEYKSIYNIVTSYHGLSFNEVKFDESSKKIQEREEELIKELRDTIRKDMEDFKLICCRIPDITGEEYNRIFGDEEYYSFFKTYLRDRIEDNIEKLRGLVNVR